ncbi:MAG: iron ABC transporter permease [Actinomycetota bacterium]
MRPVERDPVLDTLEPSPSRPRRRSAPRSLIAGATVVGALTVLPALYLVVRSWEGGPDTILDTILDARTAGLLVRTIGLALAVTATAVAMSLPLAWLTERTDLPGRRAWTVLLALPLVIPTYVGGYVFVAALGPRGLLQQLLEPIGVMRLPSIYGFGGAWLVLTLFTFPYVYLTARAALRGLDPALEEASMALGRSRRETMRSVVLPQLRPSVAAGSLLVSLYVLHDFGAVSLLRFDSFTRAIYMQYTGSFDRSRAAILGLLLICVTGVLLSGERRARTRAAYYRAQGSAPRIPTRSALGRRRWPAFAACALLVTVALGVPIAVIAYWLARGVRAGETTGVAFAAAGRSLQASGLAAGAAVIAAWPISVLTVRYPSRLTRALERASFIGYALPGLVVALALVFVGARYVPTLYQTRTMLVFAYVVLFLPQAAGALRAGLLQLNPQIEEAAHSLGSGRIETLRRVVLPLVRPGMLTGAALVFLTTMKELPATLLLAPTGFATLSTEVWSATNSASFARAAMPALLLIVLAAGPLAVMLLRGRVSER